MHRTAVNPASTNTMKKIFTFILCFISAISFAQVKPSFGLKAGVSNSGLKGDAVQSLGTLVDLSNGIITTGNRTGFFAGAYAGVPISENISLEPGLYYTQKGYELKGSLNIKGLGFLGANAKSQLQLQYIDVPLLIKGNFGGLQLFAGPQFSYLLNANLHSTAGALGFNLLNNNTDATGQFNRWDMGLTGGIGYQFTNGVNLSAAYDYGLSKIDVNKNLNAYNRGVKLGIGFSF
ncbi:MAG: porin family protein [Ferruginibacter sp.]